jgi:hypothetical protein
VHQPHACVYHRCGRRSRNQCDADPARHHRDLTDDGMCGASSSC